MSNDEAQEARNIEWQRLKAEGRELMAEVDRLLAERRDPNDLETWSNVLHFTQKQKPPPEPPRTKYTDSVVDQLINGVREETRAQLGALREEVSGDLTEIERYISGELSQLLTTTFDTIAIEFEYTRLDIKALQNKFVETDISELQSEVSSLGADHAALARTVESLSFEVANLRDTLDAIERSGKVIALRGSA